jgi:hypothetical protein
LTTPKQKLKRKRAADNVKLRWKRGVTGIGVFLYQSTQLCNLCIWYCKSPWKSILTVILNHWCPIKRTLSKVNSILNQMDIMSIKPDTLRGFTFLLYKVYLVNVKRRRTKCLL